MSIRDYRMRSIMKPREGNLFGERPSPFRNTFQNPPGPQIGDIEEAPEQDEASSFYDEMQRIRNTPTPGISAYRGALQNMPTADQYKPNWLTRIASGLSGFSAGMKDAGAGIQTAMSLNRAPYEHAMEEYTNRLGGLQEQAEMEQKDMDSRRKAIQDARELGLKYKEYEMKKEESQNLMGTRTTNAQAATTSANARLIAAQASAREDWIYTPVQGGFMAQNKNNPADSRIIPAKTVQDAQTAVARTNAGANVMSAGAAVSRAETDKARLPLEAARVDISQQRADQATGKAPTPGARSTTDKLIDEMLSRDKEFSEFVYGDPNDFNDDEWKIYLRRRDELERQILGVK